MHTPPASERAAVLAIVPAYDEAASIAAVVCGIRRAGFEVLVVDDGSRDRTAERARAAGAAVLRHATNRGKGAAVSTGLAAARAGGYDGAILVDGDGQHDPAEAPRLLACAAATSADLVLGRRALRRPEMPSVRVLTNRIMSGLISLVAGQRIRDSQCGFRYVGPRLLGALRPRTARFEIESEMVLTAAWLGLVIREVAVTTIYRPGRASRIRPGPDTLRFLRLLASEVLTRRRGRWQPRGRGARPGAAAAPEVPVLRPT